MHAVFVDQFSVYIYMYIDSLNIKIENTGNTQKKHEKAIKI